MSKFALIALLLAYNPVSNSGGTTGNDQINAGNVIKSIPADSSGGALADLANRDSNTRMYCAFDAPDGTSTPNCSNSATSHTGIGPFSVGNTYKIPAGQFPLDVTGDYYICLITRPVSLANSPVLFSVGGLTVNGMIVQLVSTGVASFYTSSNTPAADTVVSSGNTTAVGQTTVVCAGKAGSTQFVKLNGGTTASIGGAKGVADNTYGSFIGSTFDVGYGTLDYNGTISEILVAQTAASDALFTSIETAAMNCRTSGRCLPADAHEVAYYGGDAPQSCAANNVRNSILYSNAIGPGSGSWVTTGFSTVTQASAACPMAPDNSGHMTLITTSSPGAIDGVYTSAVILGAGKLSAYLANATGDAACVAALGDANGTRILFSLTATPIRQSVDLVLGSVLPWFSTYSGGTCARFCIWAPQYEVGASTPGSFCGPTTSAPLSCTSCPAANGPWYGNAAHSASRRFDLTGVVGSQSWRYTWPSYAWTQSGVVNRATHSNLYPSGFEARHASLGQFNDANYLSRAAPNVLNSATATSYTRCVVFNPTGNSTSPVLLDSSSAGGGYYAQLLPGGTVYVSEPGGGGSVATTNAAINGTTNVACFGGDSTSLRVKLNDGNVQSVASARVGVSIESDLGKYRLAVSYGFTGTISEVFATTSAATSAYLTSQTTATLACSKPGACLPDDANTTLHCYAPSGGGKWNCPVNTGGTNWVENGTVPKNAPDRYFWPSGTSLADRAGITAAGANRYDLANDTTAGSWSRCLSYQPTAAAYGIFGTGSWGTANSVGLGATGSALFANFAGSALNAGTQVTNGPNLVCWGSSGGATYVKLNGNATVAGGAWTGAGSLTSNLLYANGYSDAVGATILDYWASTTPASDALFTRIWQQWSSLRDSGSAPITIANSTPATSTVDGRVYQTAPNSIRVTPKGRILESQIINYAQYSEQFDNAWWTKSASGVTADQTISPDGTADADFFKEDGANSSHIVSSSSYTASVAPWTASVWVKPNGRTWVWFSPDSGTGGTYFDVSNCVKGSDSGSAVGTTVRGSNGWCQIVVTKTLTAAGYTARVYLTTANNATVSYVGDNASGVYIWGAQIDLAPFARSYCGPTLAAAKTCTADAATIPNPWAPADGTAVSGQWTNIIQSSPMPAGLGSAYGQFAGTKIGGTPVGPSTDYMAVAPDGSLSAPVLTFPATSGIAQNSSQYHEWNNTNTTDRMTGSIYAKATTTPGVVTFGIGGPTGITKNALINLTTSWQRFSLTTDTPFAGVGDAYITLGNNAAGIDSVARPAIQVATWGRQFEAGTVLHPLCETTFTPVTCGPGGVTARISHQLAPHSALDAAYSAGFRGATTTMGQTGPYGGANAVLLSRVNGAYANPVYAEVASGYSPAGGATRGVGIFVKPGTMKYVNMAMDGGTTNSIWDLTSTGTVAECDASARCFVTNLGNGWFYVNEYLYQPLGTWGNMNIQIGDTYVPATHSLGTSAVGATATIAFISATLGAPMGGGEGGGYTSSRVSQPGTYPIGYCDSGTTGTGKTCGPQQRWCARFRDVRPPDTGDWSHGATSTGYLLTNYPGVTSYFTIAMYVNTFGIDLWDGSGLERYYQPSHGLGANQTPHNLTFCTVDGSALTLCYDSTCQTSSGTGAGSGYMTRWPAAQQLIQNGGAGWEGYFGAVEFNSTGDPKDFPRDSQ